MPERINVLFIQSQEGFGADSAVHAHLMQHLDPSRFSVHVACTKGSGSGVPTSLETLRQMPNIKLRPTYFMPGVRERRLGTILRSSPMALLAPVDFARLCRYVRRHEIRVIHSSERPRDSLYTVLLARACRAKSVVHVHVKWSELYSAPAKWAVDQADAVFSISDYVTSTVQRMGRDPRSIYTILNCIDPSKWDPGTDGSSVRRELSIPETAKVLVSVSRLFSWKGQRELLQAFARVRARVPDVFLMIVGADAPHDGQTFSGELRQLAQELQVEDYVRFTGARSDVPRIMAAADLYTMPSFEEPFGLVFLEAMAMRKPVVAVNNGGTPEVVEHGKSGLLSAPWDIPGLAENIVTLLENPDRCRSMGQYGRERVLDYFNPERMASEAARAYAAIVE